MTIGWSLGIGLVGGSGLLALILVVAAAMSPTLALALAPAAAIGAAIAFAPFVGLVALVLLAQLDAVSNLVSQHLPISAYKLLTAATVGGYALSTFRIPRPERLGPRLPELRYAALFALWMGLSFLASTHKGPGLEHLTGFLTTMLLFYLVILLADTPRKLEAIAWALMASGLVAAVVTVVETLLGVRLLSTAEAATTAAWDGYMRSAGASDYNPTTAAHMLLATTTVALVLAFGGRRFRIAGGVVAAIGAVALVLTFARSAAIAFAAIAALFVWRRRRDRFFPFALMSGLLLVGAALPFVPELFWERMATLFDLSLDRTLLRRVSYNLIGLDLLAHHPALGVGPGNFPHYYDDVEFRWYPGREPAPRQLHNSYLETAVEFGLIGLAAFLAVMLSSLRAGAVAAGAADRRVAVVANAFAYGFGAFLIASAFMPNEDTKFMWILPGLCVAAREVARARAPGPGGEG